MPLPQKFLDRVQKILPESEWASFAEKCTEPLPKTIRTIPGFKNPTGWTLKETALENVFFIDRDDRESLPLGKTLAHICGEIYIQSLSSMLPVALLNPQPGEKILDLCGAPGSKTTLISEKMEHRGCLVANEVSSSRSKKLAANLSRMQSHNAIMTQTDGVALSHFLGQEFEKILLDAPCSSEGYGRKDAEFYEKMWSEKKIFQAAKLQKKLIESAFEMLVPGGTMLYSTCTTAPEENELVLLHLLKKYPEAEIQPVKLKNIPHHPGISQWENQKIPESLYKNVARLYPHLQNQWWDSECFFVALIKKKTSLKRLPPKKMPVKNPPQILKKNKQAEIITRLSKQFGIEKKALIHDPFFTSTRYTLAEKEGEIYLSTRETIQFAQKNLTRKWGTKILDKTGRITHEWARSYGALATKNCVEITPHEKKRWLSGYDLPEGEENHSEITNTRLIQYQGRCLGLGKKMEGKIKNKLPRDLVF
jgi:16S rRNA (cytosine1407-C5)-methyltransferase